MPTVSAISARREDKYRTIANFLLPSYLTRWGTSVRHENTELLSMGRETRGYALGAGPAPFGIGEVMR